MPKVPPTNKNKKPKTNVEKAYKKLRRSQLEAHGTGTDLTALNLILKGIGAEEILNSVTSADIDRTIEGASTLTISVEDPRRVLMQSPYLARGTDTTIDGLWFRLASVEKAADLFTLTFEDREVAIMRTYNKPLTAAWGQMNRGQFIYKMIREITELKIPFIAPEIGHLKPKDAGQDQQDNNDVNRKPGFNFSAFKSVTFKNVHADDQQLKLADIILNEAVKLKARRKVMVCAIMTATTETVMHNDPTPDSNGSSGLFQQTPPWWGTRSQVNDPQYAANKFLTKCIAADQKDPNLSYAMLCQTVQASGTPDGSNYAPWKDEADNTVTVFGVNGGDTGNILDMLDANNQSAGDGTVIHVGADNQLFIGGAASGDKYQFTRGQFSTDDTGKQKIKRENTWDASGRLAEEVQWRRFMVSGSFYYVSEPYLFRSRPRFIIDGEFNDPVLGIDFTYDVGMINAEITLTVLSARWIAPPGSVIQFVNMGIINGKWLLTDFRRSLFSPIATITLKKPRPLLPEPKKQTGINWSPAKDPVSVGGAGLQLLPSGKDIGSAVARWTLKYDGDFADPKWASSWNPKGHAYYFGAKHTAPMTAIVGQPDAPPPYDCSSFARWAWGGQTKGGVDVGGTTWDQFAKAKNTTNVKWGAEGTVPADGFKPGDLVFTHGGTHVVVMVTATACCSAEGYDYGIHRRQLSWHGGADPKTGANIHGWARWSDVVAAP